MEMENVIPANDQPTVEQAFFKTAEYGAILRTIVTQNIRGPRWPDVYNFKQYFDMLFLMTHFRPGINPQIIKAVQEWSKQKQATDDTAILQCIDLFESYSQELFNNKIIEL